MQELTLRSTQLVSANFDFFSVFLASGIMYLVLTGMISVFQLSLEARFDLDRHSMRGFRRWLPWSRAAVTAPVPAPVVPMSDKATAAPADAAAAAASVPAEGAEGASPAAEGEEKKESADAKPVRPAGGAMAGKEAPAKAEAPKPEEKKE